MKLNVYKNQKEIEKTYTVDAYDLMYGTVEDIFEVMDGLDEKASDADILKVIQKNRTKLTALIKDIFPEITDDELKRIKLKELVPFFIDLFVYVIDSFGDQKN